jgi:hypothetical protein
VNIPILAVIISHRNKAIFKIPNPKYKITNKIQIQIINDQNAVILDLGAV